jgi:hypothetical protein
MIFVTIGYFIAYHLINYLLTSILENDKILSFLKKTLHIINIIFEPIIKPFNISLSFIENLLKIIRFLPNIFYKTFIFLPIVMCISILLVCITSCVLFAMFSAKVNSFIESREVSKIVDNIIKKESDNIISLKNGLGFLWQDDLIINANIIQNDESIFIKINEYDFFQTNETNNFLFNFIECSIAKISDVIYKTFNCNFDFHCDNSSLLNKISKYIPSWFSGLPAAFTSNLSSLLVGDVGANVKIGLKNKESESDKLSETICSSINNLIDPSKKDKMQNSILYDEYLQKKDLICFKKKIEFLEKIANGLKSKTTKNIKFEIDISKLNNLKKILNYDEKINILKKINISKGRVYFAIIDEIKKEEVINTQDISSETKRSDSLCQTDTLNSQDISTFKQNKVEDDDRYGSAEETDSSIVCNESLKKDNFKEDPKSSIFVDSTKGLFNVNWSQFNFFKWNGNF